MKLAFFDSDILLDVLLLREPFYTASLGAFLLIDQEVYKGCVSAHSLLNIHYMAKKQSNETFARASVSLILEKFKIIEENAVIMEQAVASAFSDFEDAVQFYAAKSAGADYIITRNIKDYKYSTIPVLTAAQFLEII